MSPNVTLVFKCIVKKLIIKSWKKHLTCAMMIVILIYLYDFDEGESLHDTKNDVLVKQGAAMRAQKSLSNIGTHDVISEPTIDVVYTWVNGSDPEHMRLFDYYKYNKTIDELKFVPLRDYLYGRLQPIRCYFENCVQTSGDLFVISPALNSTERERFERHFHLNTIDFKRFNVTLVRLDQETGREMNRSYLFDLETHGYQILVAFYTSNCAASSYCAPLEDTFILKKIVLRKDRSKTDAEYLIRRPIDGKSQRLLAQYVQTKNLYAHDNQFGHTGYYTVLAANVVWDLSKPWVDGLKKNRFYDKDELKYSLRSLKQYAPWIRNVHIVTNGQVPGWLNVNHTNVRLVRHEQIFKNKSHLPTFNSAAIETHLHRIVNLSEKFLYFNDDILLTAPVSLTDFYDASTSTYKFYLSSDTITTSHVDRKPIVCDDPSEYRCSLVYSNQKLDQLFSTEATRAVPPHMPFFIDRSLMNELQRNAMLADDFEQTSSRRFRSSRDVQYAFMYVNYIIGRSEQPDGGFDDYLKSNNIPRNVCSSSSSNEQCAKLRKSHEQRYKYELGESKHVKVLAIDGKPKRIYDRFMAYTRMRRKFLCVNDDINYENKIDAKQIVSILKNFFESLFPIKSDFEL